VLLALFIWKNAVGFLPAKPDPLDDDGSLVSSKDAASGFANLLQRNITPAELTKVCYAEWEKSRYGGRTWSSEKLARVQSIVKSGGDTLTIYRQVSRILTERKSG
jgi:hypothetical protein